MTKMTAADHIPADVRKYLEPSRFVDSDAPEVRQFAKEALRGLAPDASDREKAVRLFEAVRDGLRYDPYRASLDPEDYRASHIATQESGYCVPKAILLAAALRAAGIPAALGFADVRNHLNTEKLLELMGSDVFIYHGYVQLWIGEESYKVTPAFNMALCERFGVKPLVFDGYSDALFHEYDVNDRRHMEYINDRGIFVDIPIEQFLADFRVAYPKMAERFDRGEMTVVRDKFTSAT